MSVEQETGSYRVEWRVVLAAAAMVAAIGELCLATAEPHQEPPREPVPAEILERCADQPLPNLCVEIARLQSGFGHDAPAR